MIEYRLIRSDRRTLSISIDREGALVVRAPKRMGVREIEAFIQQKQHWIEEKQSAVKQMADQRLQLTEGTAFPFWGGTLTVTFRAISKPVWQQGTLCLPRSDQAVQYARKWRLEQAKALIVPRVEYWAKQTGLQPSNIAFGNAKARWGSMNARTRSLRLNAALVHCPPALVDYVIVHELVHICHPNHSAAFHAAVREILPDADNRRSELKKMSYLTTMWE